MTPDERECRRARILVLAAQLDLAMANRALTQAKLARRMETNRETVCKMLKGKDGLVSTWLAAVDAAGYEVVLKAKDVA